MNSRVSFLSIFLSFIIFPTVVHAQTDTLYFGAHRQELIETSKDSAYYRYRVIQKENSQYSVKEYAANTELVRVYQSTDNKGENIIGILKEIRDNGSYLLLEYSDGTLINKKFFENDELVYDLAIDSMCHHGKAIFYVNNGNTQFEGEFEWNRPMNGFFPFNESCGYYSLNQRLSKYAWDFYENGAIKFTRYLYDDFSVAFDYHNECEGYKRKILGKTTYDFQGNALSRISNIEDNIGSYVEGRYWKSRNGWGPSPISHMNYFQDSVLLKTVFFDKQRNPFSTVEFDGEGNLTDGLIVERFYSKSLYGNMPYYTGKEYKNGQKTNTEYVYDLNFNLLMEIETQDSVWHGDAKVYDYRDQSFLGNSTFEDGYPQDGYAYDIEFNAWLGGPNFAFYKDGEKDGKAYGFSPRRGVHLEWEFRAQDIGYRYSEQFDYGGKLGIIKSTYENNRPVTGIVLAKESPIITTEYVDKERKIMRSYTKEDTILYALEYIDEGRVVFTHPHTGESFTGYKEGKKFTDGFNLQVINGKYSILEKYENSELVFQKAYLKDKVVSTLTFKDGKPYDGWLLRNTWPARRYDKGRVVGI